jgi:competence protein ComEC
MAIVLLCGTLFERKADIYNSISVAALVLMLWNTNTLFDIGFQLSFAAVVSIVYFYPRLELLIKKIPERFEEIKAVDTVLKLFAVSLAAQLGTIPFTAYYFGRVSIISLLANIPVVPISGLNTFIGFAEIIFYFINPWIAGLYTATNDFLVWFLLGFVKQAASVSFAYLETPHLNVVIVAGYYLLVLGAFNFNHMRVRTGMLILILIIGNYLLFNFIISHVNQKLTVTIIDVGQGDAVLLEFPDKKRMLVDAGPLFKKHDAGEKIIVPFLRYKGITKLDYLLITHPHSDHLGGAGSVLKSIHVDTLILNTNSSHNRMVREIFSSAQAFHVGIGVLSEGNQIYIHPGVRVYVLYPNLDHPSEGNANNNSVILKILYGNSSILFVGDAEVMAEQKIIPRYNTFLSSDILKVGHHGSNTSSSDDLLCLVHPHTAIVSVGVHNQFRHPSPFTLNRLAKHSIEIDRTDKSGAIILETDGKRWSQKEWRRRI